MNAHVFTTSLIGPETLDGTRDLRRGERKSKGPRRLSRGLGSGLRNAAYGDGLWRTGSSHGRISVALGPRAIWTYGSDANLSRSRARSIRHPRPRLRRSFLANPGVEAYHDCGVESFNHVYASPARDWEGLASLGVEGVATLQADPPSSTSSPRAARSYPSEKGRAGPPDRPWRRPVSRNPR